jgi:hypothetical protein
MTFGAITLLSVVVIYLYKPVRFVESELPDVPREAHPEEPAREAAPRAGGPVLAPREAPAAGGEG